MANRIYRGRADLTGHTVMAIVGTDVKAGHIVTINNSGFDVANAAGGRLFIVNNNDFMGQDLDAVQKAGDSVHAYRLPSDTEFQARMAAGTYPDGAPLTVSAGKLKPAQASDVIVAYIDVRGGVTVAEDALADIVTA